jgi:hypothetical protein
VFFRPISAVILIAAGIVVSAQAYKYFRGERTLGEPESIT